MPFPTISTPSFDTAQQPSSTRQQMCQDFSFHARLAFESSVHLLKKEQKEGMDSLHKKLEEELHAISLLHDDHHKKSMELFDKRLSAFANQLTATAPRKQDDNVFAMTAIRSACDQLQTMVASARHENDRIADFCQKLPSMMGTSTAIEYRSKTSLCNLQTPKVVDSYSPRTANLLKTASTPKTLPTQGCNASMDHLTLLGDNPSAETNKTISSPRQEPKSIQPDDSNLTSGDMMRRSDSLLAVAQTLALKSKLGLDNDYHDLSTDHIQVECPTTLSSLLGVDDRFESLPYKVEDYYKTTGICQMLARHVYFDLCTAFVVMLNGVTIVIDTELNEAMNIYDARWGFQVTAQAFCIYFVIELLIRFFAFAQHSYAWRDGWFRFDFILAATVVLDLWVVMPFLKILSHNGSNFFSRTVPLRVFRLIKVIRLARLIKVFPELLTMLRALGRALRAISSALVFMMFMMYFWGILLHTLLREEDELNDYFWTNYGFSFKHISDVLWTLLMDGILELDNSALIMTKLVYGGEVNLVFAGVSFVIFSLLSSLLIVQMLIGMLCNVVAHVNQEQKNTEAVGLVRQQLLGDLLEFDEGGRKISRTGLIKVLTSQKSRALLKKMKVNRVFFCELADLLYPTPETQVPIADLMDLLVLCRGESLTTVDVIASSFGFLSKELELMEKNILSHVNTSVRGSSGEVKHVK